MWLISNGAIGPGLIGIVVDNKDDIEWAKRKVYDMCRDADEYFYEGTITVNPFGDPEPN